MDVSKDTIDAAAMEMDSKQVLGTWQINNDDKDIKGLIKECAKQAGGLSAIWVCFEHTGPYSWVWHDSPPHPSITPVIAEFFFKILKNVVSYSLSDVVKLLVAERLNDPGSKLSSHNKQHEYLGLQQVSLQHIYRSLDYLSKYSKLIQKQIFQTGRNLFNLQLDVVFYDVTTFYFCSEMGAWQVSNLELNDYHPKKSNANQ